MRVTLKKQLFSWKTIFSSLLMIVVATQILFPLKINIYISNIFLYMLLGLYLLYILLNKKMKIYINYFILFYTLFVIISIGSLIWSIDINYTKPIVIRIVFLNMTLFVMYNLIKQFNIERFMLYGILIGAYFNFFIALDLINYTTPFTNPMRFTGTLARSNDVAIVMIITLIASLILINRDENGLIKKIAILALPLSLYTIFLTVSKKGIVFGGLLIFLYFLSEIKHNLKKIISLLLVVFIGVYFLFKENADLIFFKMERLTNRFLEFQSAIEGSSDIGSTADRLKFIKEGIEFFSNAPFLGTGLNTFIVMDSTGHYSHNNYIEIITGLGLIGFIIYYFIYIAMFVKLIHSNIDKRIKSILFLSIIIFLFMDTALVSYSYKIIMFMLFYISVYIEQLNKRETLK